MLAGVDLFHNTIIATHGSICAYLHKQKSLNSTGPVIAHPVKMTETKQSWDTNKKLMNKA
jgi:hypothetical protein